MFGERLRNRFIIFNCDNIAVCHIIMKLSAKKNKKTKKNDHAGSEEISSGVI